MYCKQPLEFFDTPYEYSAVFKAEIRRKEHPKPATEGEKKAAAASPQAAVYRAYEKAIQAGDAKTLKTLVPADMAKELDGPDAKDMLKFLKMFQPADIQYQKVAVDGDKAVLSLSGTADGKKVRGAAELVLENGKWKIKQCKW